MASVSVVNDIAAANAEANLATTTVKLNDALTRLSNRLRITTTADDAAGRGKQHLGRPDATAMAQSAMVNNRSAESVPGR